MHKHIIVGIDLAGTAKNPTGWALWKNKTVYTYHLYSDKDILKHLEECKPNLTAIDAPLNLPKKDIMRKADREMYKLGYPVFPPRFPAMEKLTLRAINMAQQIMKEGFKVIEVHPTSTRKALKMPTKNWEKIQSILISLGLEGDPKTRALTAHEIDAITAALTGYLYLQGKTKLIGDEEEGYIVVPIENDWRKLKL